MIALFTTAEKLNNTGSVRFVKLSNSCINSHTGTVLAYLDLEYHPINGGKKRSMALPTALV